MKVAIIDIEGVVADSSARFAKAEEAKQAFVHDFGTSDAFSAGNWGKQRAQDVYWQRAFDPESIALDVPIEGAQDAIRRIERSGYSVFLLTSRPDSLREATLDWLSKHNILLPDWSAYRLIMKMPAFQFVKTPVWKAGIVQSLVTLYGATDVLIVDDEQKNIDEHLKYISVDVQTRECYTSLKEAIGIG